jgi:hypothetical protein
MGALAMVALVVAASGCKKRVETERLDAVAAWSKAVCKCAEIKNNDAANKCLGAIKRDPKSELSFKSVGQNIYDVYTSESIHDFNDIEAFGLKCEGMIWQKK